MLSEKFLSFYEEIIDAQRFLVYIILSNYVRSILFRWVKLCDISQTWFHVSTKVRCYKKTGRFEEGIHFTENLIHKVSRNKNISKYE